MKKIFLAILLCSLVALSACSETETEVCPLCDNELSDIGSCPSCYSEICFDCEMSISEDLYTEIDTAYEDGYENGASDASDGSRAYEAGYDIGYDEGLDEGMLIGYMAIIDKMHPEHRETWCEENAELLEKNEMMQYVFDYYMNEE